MVSDKWFSMESDAFCAASASIYTIYAMSYRPLTAGVSAGSSLALALKLLDFDQRSLVDLYRSTDTARFDFLSFSLGRDLPLRGH